MASSLIEIDTPDGPMPAEWFAPRAEPTGTVVVCQEIFGVTDYIRRRCQSLVEEGYGVLAPRFYWRLAEEGVTPEITEAGPDALQRAMGLVARLDFGTAVADGVAAVQAARRHEGSSGVALLGFCFGGGLAFAVAARTRPQALVSYYGSGLRDLLHLAPEVTCPSLHHFGEADSFLDTESQRRITEAVTPTGALVHSHPGADHAFDNDVGSWHHPEASARAWQTTTQFLHEHLPSA
ncbi:dienelactone hydrolase family protein [Auraticoccus sp. F435]|uniref:Dienelactone hydrolase family protein n=1 Tax=Auraticoccus cholistanensis TaxID=2656650 RepID=A0A6A9UTZ6_9ACTN|nr:dienelactone hydrolase family protein [Auraticoccus cholistanensis]MVA76406.1 dienelactone hydrolase family protein [Auraticoccus cholistanensis]